MSAMGAFEGATFNAGRDQYVAAGDQHMTVQSVTVGTTVDEMRPTIESLLHDAKSLLPLDQYARVRDEVGGIEKDMGKRSPDRASAASRLEKVADAVKQGGSVIETGTTIVENIAKLASWIGPLAAGALGMLS